MNVKKITVFGDFRDEMRVMLWSVIDVRNGETNWNNSHLGVGIRWLGVGRVGDPFEILRRGQFRWQWYLVFNRFNCMPVHSGKIHANSLPHTSAAYSSVWTEGPSSAWATASPAANDGLLTYIKTGWSDLHEMACEMLRYFLKSSGTTSASGILSFGMLTNTSYSNTTDCTTLQKNNAVCSPPRKKGFGHLFVRGSCQTMQMWDVLDPTQYSECTNLWWDNIETKK